MITTLVLALAVSQGLVGSPPGVASARTLASFPLTTSGALIPDDALTVAHVYWNGTTLVDTKGNAWTMNGTVPQVTANPFTTTRYGAGPFSGSNYYSLAAGGAGASALNFTGDFTACVVFNGATTGYDGYLLGNYNSVGFKGWMLSYTPASVTSTFYIGNGTTFESRATASNGVLNGATVVCVGRAGSTGYIKQNLATTSSGAMSAATSAAGESFTIGTRISQPVYSHIYEIWASTTPWNETSVTAIQQRVLGHYDGSSPLSVTRALSNATYLNGSCAGTDQCLWTAPANVARITPDGLLVEPARVNYALQSNSMSSGTAATGPWSLSGSTVATVAGAPFTGTWAEVTATGNTGIIYAGATPASSATLVASAWMAKASGTGYAGLAVSCSPGTPSACTCLRSDGGACTSDVGSLRTANECGAQVSDLGTTPVRLSTIATCTGAIAATNMILFPGRYGVATGTTRFTGAQLEVGTYPTSLIVTTGTSAARNADQVSATVPAVPSKWCVAGTYKPEEGRSWINDAYAFSTGALNGANSAAMAPWSDGKLYWSVRDGAADFRQVSPTPSFAVGSSHRLIACSLPLLVTADGVPLTTNVVGSNTPGAIPSTTLYFGGTSTGAATFGGFLKNLKLCAAANYKGCK